MWVWFAIFCTFATFVLKAYAEWTGSATASALGYLAIAGASLFIGLQVKRIMDNTQVEDNDTGLMILLTIGGTWVFAFGIGVYALYKLRESLSM